MEKPAGKLWNRNFILLFQGQAVSMIGSQLAYVGVMLWLLDVKGSASLMGLLMMSASLPGVILGPIGGTLADRISRKTIIVSCDIIIGLACTLFALFLILVEGMIDSKIVALFILMIFGGIVSSFFRPAIGAAVPDLVPREKLNGANAVIQSSMQIATFIGQGTGGLLYTLIGAPFLFLVNGLSFLFSAGSEAFIQLPRMPKKDDQVGNKFKLFLGETLEGFRYVIGNPGVRTTVLMAAFLNFFLVPTFVLMPLFVRDFLKVSNAWYGYILAGLGVGSLIGYIIAGIVRRSGFKRMWTHLVLLVAFSACFVILSQVRSAPVCLGVMFLIGLFVGIVSVDLNTILQMGVPTEIRGRVFGFMGTVSGGLAPIAMGLSGVVADSIGGNIPVIYLACGIALVFISVLVSFSGNYRMFLKTE